ILKEVNKYGINNIPVVDKNKQLHGLITKSSLVETLSKQYINDQSEVY
ncbi:MAG: CBS domain-containing protein, partial [Clostridiales bacterium]|nr:CBS domain-containing protein [Clostridiales bacterium]